MSLVRFHHSRFSRSWCFAFFLASLSFLLSCATDDACNHEAFETSVLGNPLAVAFAVPCVAKHLPFLAGLFDDVAHQTVWPVAIVVALSGVRYEEEEEEEEEGSEPVQRSVHETVASFTTRRGDLTVRSLFEDAFKSHLNAGFKRHVFADPPTPSSSSTAQPQLPTVPNILRGHSPTPKPTDADDDEEDPADTPPFKATPLQTWPRSPCRRLPRLVVVSASAPRSHAENRNVAFAAAAGLKHDRGTRKGFALAEVVSFMDADDRMHPRRLELIARCLAASGARALVHGFTLAKSDSERPPKRSWWQGNLTANEGGQPEEQPKQTSDNGGDGDSVGTREEGSQKVVVVVDVGGEGTAPPTNVPLEEEEGGGGGRSAGSSTLTQPTLGPSSKSSISSSSSNRRRGRRDHLLARECGSGYMLGKRLLEVYTHASGGGDRQPSHSQDEAVQAAAGGAGAAAEETQYLGRFDKKKEEEEEEEETKQHGDGGGGGCGDDDFVCGACHGCSKQECLTLVLTRLNTSASPPTELLPPPPGSLCCPLSALTPSSPPPDHHPGDAKPVDFSPAHGHISLRVNFFDAGNSPPPPPSTPATSPVQPSQRESPQAIDGANDDDANVDANALELEAARAATAAVVGAAWADGEGPGGIGEDVAFVKALLRKAVLERGQEQQQQQQQQQHEQHEQQQRIHDDDADAEGFVDDGALVFMPARRLSLYLPGSGRRCVTRDTMYLDCSIDSAQASFAFSGALALDHPCPEGTAPGLTALEIRRLGLSLGRIELLGTWPQHSSERQEGDALDEGAVLCVPLEDLFDIGVVYFDGNTLNRGT